MWDLGEIGALKLQTLSVKSIRKSPSLAMQVAEELKTYIVTTPIPPGDKLPALSHLAKDFGVSMSVVREAVRSLEMLGILEVKHGEGIFVKGFDPKPVADQIVYGLDTARDQMLLKSLVEARKVFEVGNLELVIQRVDEKDLKKLESILKKMERHYRETGSEDFRYDLEFHTAIVKITRNDVLIRFTEILYQTFSLYHVHKKTQAEDIEEILESHRALYEAIKARDLPWAQKLMEEHVLKSGQVRLAL